jgi:copper chaperone CopZ
MTTRTTPVSPSVAAPAGFQDPATRVLSVPGLACAVPIGGGCCAAAADDAVRDELESWPGVTVERIDPEAETVTVRLDPGRSDRLSDAVDAVRDLGFPEAGTSAR